MANKNIVSQPPLMVPIADSKGVLSRAWAAFFRDLYKRTADKGGNAIDDNKNEIDEALITVGASLDEVVAQVLVNIDNITTNAAEASNNKEAILVNADGLATHSALNEAHGSDGDIVGVNDLATETLQGLVKRMPVLASAVASVASVTIADAGNAPTAYNQAHLQGVVDLTNANKTAINQVVIDLNAAVVVLNNLISNSKSANQMSS